MEEPLVTSILFSLVVPFSHFRSFSLSVSPSSLVLLSMRHIGQRPTYTHKRVHWLVKLFVGQTTLLYPSSKRCLHEKPLPTTKKVPIPSS